MFHVEHFVYTIQPGSPILATNAEKKFSYEIFSGEKILLGRIYGKKIPAAKKFHGGYFLSGVYASASGLLKPSPRTSVTPLMMTNASGST